MRAWKRDEKETKAHDGRNLAKQRTQVIERSFFAAPLVHIYNSIKENKENMFPTVLASKPLYVQLFRLHSDAYPAAPPKVYTLNSLKIKFPPPIYARVKYLISHQSCVEEKSSKLTDHRKGRRLTRITHPSTSASATAILVTRGCVLFF